ncbi:MAG: FtsQ-type POTRA domain-containing protein [Acidobacteria bacterium]|nr:FtsQ-type POTRA domain-containing protein [Acidobacteriota bacterium]
MTALTRLTTALALLVATSAGAQTAPAPPIVEIRVHGNHSTPNEEIVALSGLEVGQPSSDAVLDAARAKVEASGRFESVTVRRLERSIDVPDDFMVLIEVQERAGVSPENLTPGWVSRLASEGLWVPVLRYDEGYGATYGLQAALDGALGGTSQLAVPATWGGERRIGIEGTRSFGSPIVSRLQAGADLTRREHPAFDLVEERTHVFGRVERAVTPSTRLGVEAAHDRVRFAGARDDVNRVVADLMVDTRLDPAFPRNAVWGRASIERLDVVTGLRRRARVDASAALGLPFKAALTVRGFLSSVDGALPRYEQTMIGGGLATRGYRRGYRVGDNAAGGSLTLARPFGSPLDIVRHGVRTFVDWGAAYDAGTKVGDAQFDRGAGVGWFANLMAVNAYVDVGRGNGEWRVHVRFGTGF